MTAPGQAIQGDWRQFLRLGEQLLEQASAADQIELIALLVKEKTGCDSRVWLAKPYYPLPGEPGVETLPNPLAPDLVDRTFKSHKIACQMTDGSITHRLRTKQIQSLAIPLATQNSLLGVLEVIRCNPDETIPADEMNYLIGLASHAAVNMQVSRQVVLKNWRFNQLNLVSAVSDQISNITDLNQMCRQVTRRIAETFTYNYVAIFTLDETPGLLNFRASAGASQNMEEQPGFAIPFGEGLIGYAAEVNQSVYSANVSQDPHYRFIASLGSTRSEMVLPIQVEGRLLGVLDIQSNQVDGLHEVDQLVLHTLADSIAIGIHGAKLLAELQSKVDQLEAILEVSHKLTSILDFDRLMDEVVDALHKRFGYPFIHLFTVHSGRRKVFYHAGSGARSRSLATLELSYDMDDPSGIIPWVARSGSTYLANDVSSDEVYRPSPLTPSETQSELCVPVMMGDDVLGILDIQSDQRDAFDTSAISLFEALAGTIAISLRNANLYRSEQWRREVAVSFRDVAELVSSRQDLEFLLNTILDKLDSLLPCEVSAIWLHAKADKSAYQDGDPLILAACHGVDSQDIQERLKDSPDMQAWFQQLTHLDDPAVRSPENMIGPLGAALGYENDYSAITAPLRAGEEMLGLITLAHPTAGRYGSEAHSITATFASYAAMAIRDARLYVNAQEQAWISTILLQVSNACQNSESTDDLLETITRLLPLLIGVRKSAFFLWEEHHHAFRLQTTYGLEKPVQTLSFSPTQQPALQRLFTSMAPVMLRGTTHDLMPGITELEPNETVALLPLISRGQLLGAYMIGYTTSEQPALTHILDDEMLSFLQGIAQQVSTALENLMLFEARQQEGYVTAALLQVAQAVVTQTDLAEILDTIIHLLSFLLGIDTAIIYLWNEKEEVYEPADVTSRMKADEEYLRTRKYHPWEFNLLNDTFHDEKVSFIPLSSPDTPITVWHELNCVQVNDDNRLVEFSGQALVLAFPLAMKEAGFGVFVVKENPTAPGIQEKRQEMLSGIAQQISQAIQNDRFQRNLVEQQTLEREMIFAREIQQNFLPDELPSPPGWEVDARWQTARTVGGDFYDIFHISPSQIGLVIADVSDKGLPASLYMTVTRTLIRSYLTPQTSPMDVLTRVNEALLSNSKTAMFVTAILAVLDLTTGRLVYTNAGHNRPIVRNCRTRKARLLPKGGIALGANEDAMLTEESFIIQPGDCLLFYTDGVTEAMTDSGETFGEERLVNLVNQAAGNGVKKLLERLNLSLMDFRDGAALSDDVTLLAIGRQPDTGG